MKQFSHNEWKTNLHFWDFAIFFGGISGIILSSYIGRVIKKYNDH